MLRNTDETLLVQHAIFRQYAVDIPAKRGDVVARLKLAAEPSLHEDWRNPITDREPVHVRANFSNFSRSVGHWNKRVWRVPLGEPTARDHQVSVI